MKILMLSWEFPPIIAGGLGMAVYGIVKNLLEFGHEVFLVLPTKYDAYFHLKKPDDADSLKPVFLSKQEKHFYEKELKTSKESYFKLLGMSLEPETYLNPGFIRNFDLFFYGKIIDSHLIKEEYIKFIEASLSSDYGLFKKVKEYTIRVSRIIKNLDFDIIHAHDWLTYPAGMLGKAISKKKLIVHVHATEFDRAGGTGDGRIHNIEYSGMSSADKVIAVSNYTANLLIYRYRIDTRKIRVIHNAFYIRKLNEEKNRKFRTPVVLFMGRITLQKGPDYYLEVARKVLETNENVRFIMVGSGDMQRRIIHKSAHYRLSSKLLFSSFLNRQQVEEVLSFSDIFVLPSVSEPFGIAPLEAMAYGLVAIISKQSGVSEVVRNAYKIDFWDINQMTETICKLINDEELLKSKSRKSADEVRKINWLRVAREINKIYEDLL